MATFTVLSRPWISLHLYHFLKINRCFTLASSLQHQTQHDCWNCTFQLMHWHKSHHYTLMAFQPQGRSGVHLTHTQDLLFLISMMQIFLDQYLCFIQFVVYLWFHKTFSDLSGVLFLSRNTCSTN